MKNKFLGSVVDGIFIEEEKDDEKGKRMNEFIRQLSLGESEEEIVDEQK